MKNEIYKPPRWLSVLLTAEVHRALTVLALDKGITLAEFTRNIIAAFLSSTKEEAK